MIAFTGDDLRETIAGCIGNRRKIVTETFQLDTKIETSKTIYHHRMKGQEKTGYYIAISFFPTGKRYQIIDISFNGNYGTEDIRRMITPIIRFTEGIE